MSSSSLRRITFVGIGSIGLPMAQQIAAAGFEVVGVDPFEAQRKKATELGLAVEETPESASTADAVLCMVATPDQLRQAALGDGGLVDRMREGSTLIVMSTVGPGPVAEVASAASGAGIQVLDIPVTGGVARAVTGELSLFVSGEPQLVERHRPLLESMGKLIDCGVEVGRGQSFKAVNQLLCSVHLAAAAEALAFAEELGLDLAEVLPAVAGGAGGSWMLSDRGPRMLQGLDVEVTSAIGIFVKDSGLVSDIAAQIGFDAPLVSAARDRFRAAEAAGWGRRDDSQVIQTYRGLSETT